MLSAADALGWGRGRAPVPAARVQRPACAAAPDGDELHFLIEDVGPGTKRLCELGPGDELLLVGPLGIGFAAPRDGRRAAARRRRRRDRAARDLAGRARRPADATVALLGFRDARTRTARACCRRAAVATDDGSVGHHGLVTELLERRARRRRRTLEVYACGPPAMLEAVRALCAERATSRRSSRSSRGWRAGSAPASAASCRPATATSGCASTGRCSTPTSAREQPARRRSAGIDASSSAGSSSSTRSSTASGTFDAIAAQRAFGDELLERFPFAAFVSKTVTLAPRQGNPPPRLWELAGGLINSIGLPNKGLEGYLAHDLPSSPTLPVR